jgi:TRAP-type C4-dicarboxylate transport system permease small subunit
MSESQSQDDTRQVSFLGRIEELFLSGLLTTMIVLACIQIILRSFFSNGLDWADPLLRHLVLWSGFLGAAMATSRSKHIGVDLLGFILPKSFQPWVNLITNTFSTIVAGFLTYAAILFIRNEMEFGGTQLLGAPSWIWNMIFPLAFALITLRFFFSIIGNIKRALVPSSIKKQ